MSWWVESGTLGKLVAFQPGRGWKFTVFLLSEYSARRVVLGYRERGKLARMIHPLTVASNTHFFVSVARARKETFDVTAALMPRLA
jgi:hypothetical protein